MADLVYGAAETVTFHNGTRIVVHKDEAWYANDPFVKACPEFFVGVPDKVQDTQPVKKAAAAKRSRK